MPEPTSGSRSATHLATLKPLKCVGGKMAKEACQDPEKAKYIGKCHGGNRVWGELGADIFVDDKGKQSFAAALARRRCPGCHCPHLLHRRRL